jgi:hypothetical protein
MQPLRLRVDYRRRVDFDALLFAEMVPQAEFVPALYLSGDGSESLQFFRVGLKRRRCFTEP